MNLQKLAGASLMMAGSLFLSSCAPENGGDDSGRVDSDVLLVTSTSQPGRAVVNEGRLTLDALLAPPGNGFFLLHFNGREVTETGLAVLQRKGEEMVLGVEGQELPRFRFKVTEAPEFVALHLQKAEGDFSQRDYGLTFRAGRADRLEAFRLNYMVRDGSDGGQLALHWPWLWNSLDPQGAFAVIAPDSDAARDRSLAAVWAEGTLPHPVVDGAWTAERALEWVDAFHAKFSGLSETKLSASSPEELARLTDWMHGTGIKRVYLHTDTWRGEYWPRKRSFVDVNPQVFPGGRSDLIAYRRSLEEKGMQLRLHNVSAGIGQEDREFILGGTVDPRLSTWVKGTLDKPLSLDDEVLYFRPEAGAELPHVRLPGHCNLEYFRIGGEVLRVREMSDVDGPVWKLSRLNRGERGSVPSGYPAGTEVAGLVSAYGQNYVPDANSPLLEEMADRYARIINEAGLDHQHYDGAEIHSYLEPWGFDKFSYLMAGKIDRAVTSSTSGGRTVYWNMEYQFSRVKDLKELGYWSMEIPVLLEEHRPANDELDAHYQFANLLLLGATRVGFYKPEPMFGINAGMLDHFGLLPRFEAMVNDWKEALAQIGEREKEWLQTLLAPVPKDRLRQRGNHWQSQDVPVLERTERGFQFVPVRVLHRKGVDGIWLHGQEFGPVGPRQYIQPGESIMLSNPYPAQAPQLTLQVMPPVGGAAGSTGPVATKVSSGNEVVESYRTGADLAGRSEGKAAPTRAARRLWPVSQKAITQAGFTRLEVKPGELLLTAENPTGEPVWEERELPSWSARLPIRGRRAIGMEIEGDGSGAVLVLQVTGRGTRDYVVRLDFKGKRRVVIPSGEVAWSAAYWGWRFDAKHFDYQATISGVKLGFGYIPPRTRASVKVTALDLLDNQPGGLVDPVIRVGAGELRIRGEIDAGEYLSFSVKNGARVFDRNWNFLRTLPHHAEGWIAPEGDVPVVIEHSSHGRVPWIALRLTTRGEPFSITPSGVAP